MPPRSVPADQRISAYTLQPPLREKAEAHARAGHLQYLAGTVWGLLAIGLLLRLRVAPRLQRLAERLARRRFFQVCLFMPLFVLAMALLDLPLAIWGHTVERSYGLSIQGWGSFARDWAISQAILMVVGVVLVWLLYTVMRRSRRWWLWAWAAILPVLLFIFFIGPFVIEPLFYKFAPLEARDPQLASQLAEISHHEIPVEKMFVMEASEKLRAVNAYVTGLGASKRVVVWDTSLDALTHREIDFVFGHELGHYAEGHVVIGLCLGALSLLGILWVASRLLGGAVRRWGAGWQIERIDDLSSLPLIILVASLLTTLTQPLGAAGSRYLEHRADAFGLRAITGVVDDPGQAAAHAFQRLGEIDLAEPDPSPLVVFWLYDHPPIRDRVQFVLNNRQAARHSSRQHLASLRSAR